MTSRGKSAARGFETEIERSREEGNWKKAVELAQQLKQRSPQHASLAHFLIGEAKLEAHLEQFPPCSENEERAVRELGEAKGFLTLATDEAGAKAGVALDAHLLLGKLHYACGEYNDALKHFQAAELATLTEKELPVRSLRIVAESYAIKGLCLEAGAGVGEGVGAGGGTGGGGSKYKAAEREADTVRALELAADLTLLYLQRTGSSGGPLLEAALLRAPALHLRGGRTHRALQRTREMLSAAECPGTAAVRLALARQLAELLLRGAAGPEYRPPAVPPPPPPAPSQGTLGRRRDDNPDGPWKPRKYASLNQFVPAGSGAAWEEILLALLVGEALAVRDAVLSQSAEFRAARELSLHNAIALVDLLALAAARWGQLCLLLESLERAMKFSFGCVHVWRQRALATAAAAPRPPRAPHAPPHPAAAQPRAEGPAWAAAVKARAVARRAVPMDKEDAAIRLVAANTCYQMGYLDEGIALAEEAMVIEEARGGPLEARACAMAGAGRAAAARATWTTTAAGRAQALEQAKNLLVKAATLDDNDHMTFYYLALLYTRNGQLNDAMDACRACLTARPECGLGLRLCCALWACACAGRRQARALHVARLARHHYPQADWPLAALATLQIHWDSGEAALATGKELLALVSGTGGGADGGEGGDDSPHYMELDALSDAMSVRDSTVGGQSVSRALSDTASTVSISGGRGGRTARAGGWLTLAGLCLRLGRPSAAAGCVAEAHALTPNTFAVLYTRGLVHAAEEQWDEARECFVDALALNPASAPALAALGGAYYALGWLRLAEQSLRASIALEGGAGGTGGEGGGGGGGAHTWRQLAQVLCALDDPLAAADCNIAALQLQPKHTPLALPP